MGGHIADDCLLNNAPAITYIHLYQLRIRLAIITEYSLSESHVLHGCVSICLPIHRNS